MFVKSNWNKYPNYFNNLHNRITNRNFCLLIKYTPTNDYPTKEEFVLGLAQNHPYLFTLIIKTIRHREGEGIFGKNQINLIMQDNKEGGITKLSPDPKKNPVLHHFLLQHNLWSFRFHFFGQHFAFGRLNGKRDCRGPILHQFWPPRPLCISNQFSPKAIFCLVNFNFVWNCQNPNSTTTQPQPNITFVRLDTKITL